MSSYPAIAMRFFDLHAPTASIIAQSAVPASSQAKLLLVVLAIVLVTLLGLILLTTFRYLLRRWSSQHDSRRSPRAPAGSGARELSPWETAGRRANVATESDDEDDRDLEASA